MLSNSLIMPPPVALEFLVRHGVPIRAVGVLADHLRSPVLLRPKWIPLSFSVLLVEFFLCKAVMTHDVDLYDPEIIGITTYINRDGLTPHIDLDSTDIEDAAGRVGLTDVLCRHDVHDRFSHGLIPRTPSSVLRSTPSLARALPCLVFATQPISTSMGRSACFSRWSDPLTWEG